MFTFVSMTEKGRTPNRHLAPLKGRYITLHHLEKILHILPEIFRWTIAGYSELGRPIYRVDVGKGTKKIFAWSQMHGNESTTTKALMDLFVFIESQKEDAQVRSFLEHYTLIVIPVLNPDGAQAYTRENSNGVDLNRDASSLSQVETLVWKRVLDEIEPDLCLNLHDQRTIYGLANKKPATVSFLSPSADKEKEVTPARKIAMQHIARMRSGLEAIIPGQVGRYDDAFNLDCVGDQCSMRGIPTILFEAGHYPGDYQREHTRACILEAFLILFGIHPTPSLVGDYWSIPENSKDCRDILIRNVRLAGSDQDVDLALQFKEELDNEQETVLFTPVLDKVAAPGALWGHQEVDALGQEVLINNQEKGLAGEKITSIVLKSSKDPLFRYKN